MLAPLTSRAFNRRMAGAGLMRRAARGGGGRFREAPDSVANLLAWWRADSGIAVGAGVSAWTSRVNGHVLTQDVTAKQPLHTTAPELGGRPVLSFDGVDDRITSTAPASVWRCLHDGTGMTALVACVPRAGGNLTVWSTRAVADGTGTWFRVDGSANSLYLFSYAGLSSTITATPAHAPTIALNTRVITDVSYSESASPEWTARTADAIRASGASAVPPDAGDSMGTFSLGGFSSNGAEGAFDIAEVILYSRAIAVAEKTDIYGYLAARYV